MGAPMARHLAKNGHPVTVYNRTAAKALAWVALHGNRAAPTPAEAAEGAELVFICVGNDDDVREVVLGESGCLSAMAPGSILVDHTTASAGLAREIAARCAEVADKLGVSSAIIAIAWLMGKPMVTAPVIGVSRVSQLEDLARAAEISLSDEDCDYLEAPYKPLDNLPSLGMS